MIDVLLRKLGSSRTCILDEVSSRARFAYAHKINSLLLSSTIMRPNSASNSLSPFPRDRERKDRAITPLPFHSPLDYRGGEGEKKACVPRSVVISIIELSYSLSFSLWSSSCEAKRTSIIWGIMDNAWMGTEGIVRLIFQVYPMLSPSVLQ